MRADDLRGDRALRAANRRPAPLGAGARRARRRRWAAFVLQLVLITLLIAGAIWAVPLIVEATSGKAF